MQIIVADDHNLVREGLKPFLHELGNNVQVLDAASLDEAMDRAANAEDLVLVLLDLRMPGMNGLGGIETFHRRFPTIPVVVLTGHINRDDVMAAVRTGASGYIPKTISGTALINALRLVLSGEKYLPAFMLTDEPEEPTVADSNRPIPGKPTPLDTLSPREREILSLLIEGRTNKDIARRLDLQEITIKIHLRNVYRKIGAVNRAQAVRIAMSAGWTVPATPSA
jgi:DNA-binding NarL/FixJ family response regulator